MNSMTYRGRATELHFLFRLHVGHVGGTRHVSTHGEFAANVVRVATFQEERHCEFASLRAVGDTDIERYL